MNYKAIINRAFLCDVIAGILVYQPKMIFKCFFHQYGRQLLCCFIPQGLSENDLYFYKAKGRVKVRWELIRVVSHELSQRVF